jgi:hypothetical protein
MSLPQDLKQLQIDKDFYNQTFVEMIKGLIVFGYVVLLFSC